MEDKILIFISLLAKYNEDNDNLINLYKTLIKKDRVLNELTIKLDNSIFYHNRGKELYELITDSITSFISDMDSVDINRKNLQDKLLYLKQITNDNWNEFQTLETSSASIDYITKNDDEIFSKYYRSLINIIIYIFFIYSKEDKVSIEYPKIENASSLNDVVRNRLIPQLLNNNQKMATWIIKPQYGNINPIKISQKYQLQYSNLSYIDLQGLYKRKTFIHPNIFFDKDSGSLVGTGNIISFECKDSISMIGAKISREIPKYYKINEDFTVSIMDPVKNLQLIFSNKPFVISPNKYIDFLNSLSDTQAIIYRKTHKKCIICGRTISSGNVCDEHEIQIYT